MLPPFCQTHAIPNPPHAIPPKNPLAPETLPVSTSRKVLVVGGGVAGISAALELAERGYQVVLCEAAAVLGGRLATPRLSTSAGDFNVERGLAYVV